MIKLRLEHNLGTPKPIVNPIRPLLSMSMSKSIHIRVTTTCISKQLLDILTLMNGHVLFTDR